MVMVHSDVDRVRLWRRRGQDAECNFRFLRSQRQLRGNRVCNRRGWYELGHEPQRVCFFHPRLIPRDIALHIDLVPNEHAAEPINLLLRQRSPVLEFVPPLLQRLEGLRLVHVEHEQHSVRAAEERGRQTREAFLAGRVLSQANLRSAPGTVAVGRASTHPYLQRDLLRDIVVVRHGLGDEVGADSGAVSCGEAAGDVLQVMGAAMSRSEAAASSDGPGCGDWSSRRRTAQQRLA